MTISPRPVTITVLVVCALITMTLASWSRWDDRRTRSLCAEFENTFGLYPDASVTIRGIEIGTVVALTPAADHVRVEMTIQDRTLPADIRAAVVNSSILTDRRIELIDATYWGGPLLPENACIAREHTRTPVAVSAALASFGELVDQLTASAPDGTVPLQALVAGADREFGELGPVVNRELRALADVLASPDTFLRHLGELLDNSAELSRFVTDEWEDIKTSILTFGPGLELLQRMLVIVKVLVGKLAAALEPMDRLFNEHFPYLMEILDSTVPVVTLARTRAEESSELLATIPGVILMLRTMIEARPGALSIDYQPPTALVGATDPVALCRAINQAAPEQCRPVAAGAAALPLPLAIVSAIGATP
ncbi:MlaD family protein [Nocardia goodfellowii]